MTPEQRRAEILIRIDETTRMMDQAMIDDSMIFHAFKYRLDGLKAQLAALEAEVGHEPKETNDGEA